MEASVKYSVNLLLLFWIVIFCSCDAKAQRFFEKSLPYGLLRETVDIMANYDCDEKEELDYLKELFVEVDKRASAGLTITREFNALNVALQHQLFSVKNLDDIALDSLLSALKPKVDAMLERYKIPVTYENYMCEVLLARHGGWLKDRRDTSLIKSLKYKGHINFDNSVSPDDYFIYAPLYTRTRTIPAGTSLIEVNHIPCSLLSIALINKIFYLHRNDSVQLKFRTRAETVEVYYCAGLNAAGKELYVKKFPGNILYVKMMSVESGDADIVNYALTQDTSKISSVVFDLRGNRGGAMDDAFLIAATFAEKGTVVGELKARNFRNGKYISTIDTSFKKCKVLVVTDSFTAGAAEIIAVGLKKFAGAQIIGKKTSGKVIARRVVFTKFHYGDVVIHNYHIVIDGRDILDLIPLEADKEFTNELTLNEILKLAAAL